MVNLKIMHVYKKKKNKCLQGKKGGKGDNSNHFL